MITLSLTINSRIIRIFQSERCYDLQVLGCDSYVWYILKPLMFSSPSRGLLNVLSSTEKFAESTHNVDVLVLSGSVMI